MFLVHFVISVGFFQYFCVTATHNNDETQSQKKQPEDELDDIQHRTPLIDIVFTDGSKRTCTGAIIHDSVVITAGHCFLPKAQGRKRPSDVEAELTGSFVVIGTKKKFDSGYEQYLPIERVITHPDMKGWSCDLALVHTFASMTADQIGAIMPLAGEKTSTAIEPNVTILSWGRTTDIEAETDNPCCVNDKDCDSAEITKCQKVNALKEEHHNHGLSTHTHVTSAAEELSTMQTEIKQSTVLFMRKNVHSYPRRYPLRKGAEMEMSTKVVSRYLSPGEAKNIRGDRSTQTRADDEDVEDSVDPSNRRLIYEGQQPMEMESKQPKNQHPKPVPWRRQIGAKEVNRLTLETFGFLNAATCKKMLLRAQPDMEIHGNEIVCYASDDHYVTEEDSGAPVVRLGQLIAVTVGGIRSDGDHVAVGMKLSYFCPWINENLPAGDANLNCWAHIPTNDNDTEILDDNKRPNVAKL